MHGFFNFYIRQRLLCGSHEIILDVQTEIRLFKAKFVFKYSAQVCICSRILQYPKVCLPWKGYIYVIEWKWKQNKFISNVRLPLV